MVAFVCDLCQASLKKAKVDLHCRTCPAESVSCLACSKTFFGDDFRAHTECISEAQKYEGKLFKGKAHKNGPPANGSQVQRAEPTPTITEVKAHSSSVANAPSCQKRDNPEPPQAASKKAKVVHEVANGNIQDNVRGLLQATIQQRQGLTVKKLRKLIWKQLKPSGQPRAVVDGLLFEAMVSLPVTLRYGA